MLAMPNETQFRDWSRRSPVWLIEVEYRQEKLLAERFSTPSCSKMAYAGRVNGTKQGCVD